MKKPLMVCVAAMAAGLSLKLSAATIVPNSVKFAPRHAVADITYTLGTPAIVTMAIETNTLAHGAGEWLPVNGVHVQHVTGDVNRLVREVGTQRTIRWHAYADMPERKFLDGTIRAVLTAWATNAPPDWLVADLTKQEDVRFYATTNDLPFGFSSDAYRLTHLLMRKIPAAGVTWMMGTPPGEHSMRDAEREIQHYVMLSEDYYMGVYEMTQGQCSNGVSAAYSDFFTDAPDALRRPRTNVSVTHLRGQNTEFGSGIWWPNTGHQVTDGSIIGVLRRKTGLSELDLPTAAQWEYACRAGTTGAVNTGGNISYAAWIYANSAQDTYNGARQTHVVGLKAPNAWLLYDMLGNVQEICLDRGTFGDTYRNTFTPGWEAGAVTVDPDGGMVGSPEYARGVVKLGGSWNEGDDMSRSGTHCYGGWSYAYNNIGFRLCLPARFH